MVSLALSLDRSTWNGQITVKAGFSLFPILLFFFNSLLCVGAIYTVESFNSSFPLMSMAYLVNLLQLSLWEYLYPVISIPIVTLQEKDSEELFSIDSTVQEHQMIFALSPFNQPHAALLLLVTLPSVTAFYTIGNNIIVGSGFILMAGASCSAVYQLMFPSKVINSPAFDFWTEWTGLKLFKLLAPTSSKDRSEQSEVLSQGLVDDERETSEKKSLICEAERLEKEEGRGDNIIENRRAQVKELKARGLKYGVVDGKTDEDEWEYVKNIDSQDKI